MSLRRPCFSQSLIVDVLRAILSRPINCTQTTIRSKTFRHTCHQAQPWLGWTTRPPMTPARRMYCSRALSTANDTEKWQDQLLDEIQTEFPKRKSRFIQRDLPDGRTLEVQRTKMRQPQGAPKNIEDYNKRIMFAVLDNKLNKAINYIHDMERRRIRELRPNSHTYTILINGFCKVGDMERAKKWFQRMKRNRLQPDVFTYTCLIDGYMRLADVRNSEAMFKAMMSKGIRPTLVTYNVLMHHSVRQLDVSTAVKFWSTLVDAGLQPDAYTFAIMMHGLGDEGRVDQAWKLYEQMKEENVDINAVVATTLMGIHVKHHDNSYAIELFRKFFESDRDTLLPTSYTRNVMLNAVVSNANLQTIQEYYEQFQSSLQEKQSGLKSLLFNGADVFTYTTFMRAFLRRNSLPMVSQVYQDMRARHIKPTVVTYSILMLAHAYIPDPDTCVRIFTELKKGGIEPNVVMYTIVMRAWAKAGRWDEMKKTYAEMKAANIEPNKSTMSVLQWGSEYSQDIYQHVPFQKSSSFP